MHSEKKVNGKRAPLAEALRTQIAELMTRDVVTVRAETSLESVIDLFLERGLSRLPVVDEAGRVIGIIAKSDVLFEQHTRVDREDQAPSIPAGRNIRYQTRGFHVIEVGATVRDIMTGRVLTLPESATVAQAAELMASHNLHGIPVVSAAGQVVGMLSPNDIAGWVAGL
jgi:CBS domain-containing protein